MIQGIATQNELLAAWAVCRAARDTWLVGDPLRFVDFDALGAPPEVNSWSHELLESLVVSRPKPSGGIRYEFFLDPFSATVLQVVAERIMQTRQLPVASVSARLFGIRLREADPYDLWTGSIPVWIRRQLGVGRTVVAADIANFFPCISRSRIEAVLAALGEPALADEILATFDILNQSGRVEIAGLPVAPDEIFWLIADLSLQEFDDILRADPMVTDHVRWVDDVYVAVPSERAGDAEKLINSAAQQCGFSLNPAKTQHFVDTRAFETFSYAGVHRSLDRLFLIADSGDPGVIDRELRELRYAVADATPEATRVIKRIYGLGAKAGSSWLAEHAEQDLGLYPAAEVAILNYATSLAVAAVPMRLLENALLSPRFDSTRLAALRGLLAHQARVGHAPEILEMLGRVAQWVPTGGHPLAWALAVGAYVTLAPGDARGAFSLRALEAVGSIPSGPSRRVAYEFLATLDTRRAAVLRAIKADSSRSVQLLARALDGSSQWAGMGPVRRFRKGPYSWGGADAAIARALLPERVAHALFPPLRHG